MHSAHPQYHSGHVDGAVVRDTPGRKIGNQNGHVYANLVIGTTARTAGRDKGKENVKAHSSMMAKTTAEKVMSCVVLKHLFAFKSRGRTFFFNLRVFIKE